MVIVGDSRQSVTFHFCKFQRNEVSEDKPGNRNTGVFPLHPEYDWRTIAARAWTHGMVLDALDRLGLADMKRTIATGHSRCGKTALLRLQPLRHRTDLSRRQPGPHLARRGGQTRPPLARRRPRAERGRWLALLDFAAREFFGKSAKQSYSKLAYPDATGPVHWKAP